MSDTGATTPARLRGGLVEPERGHMPTLFTLILCWGVTAASVMVLVPFVLNRLEESRWTDSGEIAFWLLLSFVSTAMGAMSYVLAYPKGGKVAPFFIGAAPFLPIALNSFLADMIGYDEGMVRVVMAVTLFPLALLIVQMRIRGVPDSPPQRATGAMKVVDRLTFRIGNLYFGITQILVIVVFLILGTIHETSEGGDRGNESALANYYNAPWFGALFFLFFLTIYCATMRKYPFRISQIGWLTVHSGLLILIVGGMAMFWGSFSGNMPLFEGQTSTEAQSRWERVLDVEIPDADFKQTFLITTDRNPQVKDERQEITFQADENGRTTDYRITLDRYEPKARLHDALVPRTTPGETPTAATRLALRGVGPEQEIVLVEGGPMGVRRIGPQDRPLTLSIYTVPSLTTLEGIGHVYPADDPNRGELVATNSKKSWRLPIVPLDVDANASDGRGVKHPALGISDHDVKIHIVRYFDALRWDGGGSKGLIDGNPGETQKPAIEVRYEIGDKSTHYLLTGDGNVYPLDSTAPTEGPEELKLAYACTPEISFDPNEFFVLMGPGDRRSVAISDGDGVTRLEPLELDREYRFSDEAPIRLAVMEAHADAELEETVVESTKRNPFRAIRATVTDGKNIVQRWLPMSSSLAFRLGEKVVRLSYKGRPLVFPFSLSLIDFRHINYPNSRTPMVFETNVVLRDAALGVEESTLVDMNHPLMWSGFRFFNQAPLEDPRSNRRGVLLVVNRNPGYWTLVLGTIVTSLGMVLVFFFKPKLRVWERRRRERLQAATAAKGS